MAAARAVGAASVRVLGSELRRYRVSAMSAVRVTVAGDLHDLTDRERALSVQAVHVPHERMAPAMLEWHSHGADGELAHWSGCAGSWAVLVVKDGSAWHVWRAPSQRSAERLVASLRRWLADGSYPVDESRPGRIVLGELAARADAKGRLRVAK